MKRVILIRHARANPESFTGKDFDRSLMASGVVDAQKMAAWLLVQNIPVDLICTSTARRAIDTAKLFREQLKVADDRFVLMDSLYEPSVQSFYQAAEGAPDDAGSLIIVSHNPGITMFANETDCHLPVQMLTCSLFGFETEITRWMDFGTAPHSFLFFKEP